MPGTRAQPESTTTSSAGRDLGGPRESRCSDRMELAAAAVRVAEYDDDARRPAAHEPRRRSQRKKSSVPITVTTSLTRLLPLQLRLAARSLAHVHGDLLDAKALGLQSQQRLDLGCSAHVRLGHHEHRLGVHGSHPARRVVERTPEPKVHRLLQQADSEATARRRNVPLVVVAFALGESRADRDVTGVRPHQLEQACELVGRMLPVGIDPAADTRSRARPPRDSRRRCRPEGHGSRRTRRRSLPRRARPRPFASVEPSSITSTSASGSVE